VCVENVFPIGQKRQKLFPPKKMSQKKKMAEKKSEIFFQILENKKNLILKKNIFWIFIF